MSRFPGSKFRRAEARPARRQAWIGGIHGGSPAASSNHIKTSRRWIVFSTNSAGVLGAVPLESRDGGQRAVSQLRCYSGVVADFDFSPFDEQVLATCSAEEAVKVWRLLDSDPDLSSSLNVTLGPKGGQAGMVLFHPTADGILASGAQRTAKVWDVEQQQQPLTELDPHGDLLQSLAWSLDGTLLGSSCKDKMLRIFDPRAGPAACQSVQAHENGRDSRLVWVNSAGGLLSIGFNQVREREVRLWDTRAFTGSLASVTLDASPRPLIPLFDPDTGLLVLMGKGEDVLFCYEVLPAQPALTEVTQCRTESKAHGIAWVPKTALDVLACEVMRVLQLTDHAIVPVSYTVPRKSMQEFHEDLFPCCTGNIPATSAETWWAGDNSQVQRISLHPAHRPSRGFSSPCIPSLPPESRTPDHPQQEQAEDLDISAGSGLSSPTSSLTSPSSAAASLSATSGFASSPSQRSLQSILGPSSGFRHIQGTVLPRSTHITNLKGLNLTTPGESDGFCANRRHVAVPLLSAGGQVAILELSKPGRLPDVSLPTIENGGPVSDLCWDPFDLERLAIAGEDAKIRLWRVTPEGLRKSLREPEAVLRGHTEKIYSVKFHPLAADVLASSSYDLSVRIWDVRSGRQALLLNGHKDQIFGIAWSPNGRRLATVCKDGKVRLYEPRQASEPLQEGPGPEGGRGARIAWVCGGKNLLVSGFDSHSERQLSIYQVETVVDGPVARISLDVSPSTLIPFYDTDTGMVFLTGKGDTRVFMYEIVPEAPFFLECNSFFSNEPHKGFQFLPKPECDVREVEVARALRLRQSSIEPVAFRVPRIKKEFFQDDLYPATEVWWEPALSAAAWLEGSDGQHRKISLQPKAMTPVSKAPKDVPSRKYVPSSVYLEEKSDEQKKEELLNAMVARLGNREDPLPQDSFEGVDEEEWD